MGSMVAGLRWSSPASALSRVEKGREKNSISRHLDLLLRKPLVPNLEFEPCLSTGIAEWS